MEPFIEDKEEQDLHTRHRERIERMRREKEKQEKWRRLIRKFWPIGAVAVGLVFIVMIATGLSGDEKSDEELTQATAQGSMEQTSAKEEEEVPGIGSQAGEALQNIESNTESVADGWKESEEGKETLGQEPSESEKPMTSSPPYAFKEAENVVTVHSEKVLSSNAILIDESMDMIIASKGAKERISPASMTKVLTVLVAAENIAAEELDDTFAMTLEFTDYAFVNDCSTAGFLKDEAVTVRDLFYGTILPSGGEAAVALATYVAGSHEAFVGMMNEKLEELGLSESAHFTNCVGLYDEEHYCTVYDVAVIMKAALQNEFCKEILTSRTYNTMPTEQHPEGILLSNWFLRRIEDCEMDGKVIGAKTGYVSQSQSCAVSYGLFDENPYICVTTGSSSSWNCIYDHVEIYTQYIPKEE